MGLSFRGKIFLNEYTYVYIYCTCTNAFGCVFNFIKVAGNFYQKYYVNRSSMQTEKKITPFYQENSLQIKYHGTNNMLYEITKMIWRS